MRISLIALLLVLCGTVTACGGGEEPDKTSPTADSPTGPTGATGTAEHVGGDRDGETNASTGKGDQGGEKSPRAEVRAAIEGFFVSGDPELACEDLVTERLVRSAYGDRKGCARAQQPGATPSAVEIERLQLDGDDATALVVPRGGPNDKIETKVSLVRGPEGWQLDSLEADVPAGP